MSKKLLYWLTIFLLIITSARSKFIQPYTFSTEDSGSGTNVIALWFTCTNSGCTQIIKNPTSNLFSPNPNSLGSNAILTATCPDCSETSYGYKIRFFKNNYQSMSVGWGGYPCDYVSYPLSPISVSFGRKDNCQATFKFSATSCVEAGLPLSILTDTNLSADTSSAFSFSGYYYPSTLYDPTYTGTNFDEWIGVNTNMNVNIKDAQGNSVSRFPSTQTHFIYSIAPNNHYNFQYTWQTSKNTEPGYYDIRMVSTVPDEKCDQTNMQPVEQTMTVYIAPSLDGCRAELQNFAMTTTNIQLTSPITFSGKKLNEYQDWNYTSISACEAKNAQLVNASLFDASYNLTIINTSNNKPVYSYKSILSRNTYINSPAPFNVNWTAPKAGSFKANLTLTSADSGVCGDKGKTASSTLTFQVGNNNDHDGYYDLEGDCDDNNPNIYPFNNNQFCNCNSGDGKNPGSETCDGIDNDCDGVPDDGIDCNTRNYYCDNDKDSLYSISVSFACQWKAPGHGVAKVRLEDSMPLKQTAKPGRARRIYFFSW